MLPLRSTSSTTSREVVSVELIDNIAPKFYDVHHAIHDKEYTSFWLKGGRGSTKSSFIALQIILGIVKDPDANAFVTRKVGDTIRLSVLNTLLWAIGKLGLSSEFTFTRAPAEITYKRTGQKIIMKGLDDPLKVKSIKLQKGYFKYLWFEEGAEFSGPEEIRSVEQSVLRGGEDFVEFVSYNPPNDPAAWVNKYSLLKIPDRLVHESNYLDVPAEWLGGRFIKDAENLKEVDYLAYQHEYLGQAVGRAEQIVFHGMWEERAFELPDVRNLRFYFGADWGFANDPTALIRSFVQDDYLYVDYEAFGYGVEIDEIHQLFKSVPEAQKWPIKGDNSRPETISYMRRQGFNIDAADKWKGSVEDGIAHLKGFKKIIVHPRCTKLINELQLYSYKVDKVTGDVLPIIVDKHNHGIDALRYSLDGYIQNRGGLGVWMKLGQQEMGRTSYV
jgi:PBSX family phage terminase large subunit